MFFFLNYFPFASARRNRLRLPTEAEIDELEPHFRHLKNINLRRCNIRQWSNLLHIARLWPNIEQLSIAENSIGTLSVPDQTKVFKSLKFLDLKGNPLNYFNEVLKLGNLSTLQILYCISNHIESVQLPDCEPDARLDIFPNLIELNLHGNFIVDQVAMFNELDKLPVLTHLTISVNDKIGFEETFNNAIAHISQLTVLNKKAISAVERRGAEYDIWKRNSVEWVKSNSNNERRMNLLKRCRAYPRLVASKREISFFLCLQIKTNHIRSSSRIRSTRRSRFDHTEGIEFRHTEAGQRQHASGDH